MLQGQSVGVGGKSQGGNVGAESRKRRSEAGLGRCSGPCVFCQTIRCVCSGGDEFCVRRVTLVPIRKCYQRRKNGY